ncbi:hypothetical protein CLOM_g13256 [Closterium sp. NIES-68]|nr:hypothetical protein CLOM_g13256 [Closterium sp. NIES-68]
MEFRSTTTGSTAFNSSSTSRAKPGIQSVMVVEGTAASSKAASARVTEAPSWDDSLNGWTDLRMAAQVKYQRSSSSHQVCYTAPFPGPYVLSIHLLFNNAFQLRNFLNGSYNKAFHRYPVVALRNLHVASPPRYFPRAFRHKLPRCTPALLRASGNEGYWAEQQWRPHACRLHAVQPQDARKCFHRKQRVLLMGDSQMRYFFGFLLPFLSADSRTAFTDTEKANMMGFHGFHGFPKEFSPFNESNNGSSVRRVYHTPVRLPLPVDTFYGSLYNGFTHKKFNFTKDGRACVFNLTYVSHMGSSWEFLPAWMFNASLTGGEVVRQDGRPFGLVAFGSTLHDLITLNSTRDYRSVACSQLLPAIRRHFGPSRVTLFGPWAAREDTKPVWLRYKSNNVRGMAFEEQAARLLPLQGFERFVPMTPVTLPRPDLSPDSTHYSWLVTLAMLDIWYTTACL